jgi:hypothetical protein
MENEKSKTAELMLLYQQGLDNLELLKVTIDNQNEIINDLQRKIVLLEKDRVSSSQPNDRSEIDDLRDNIQDIFSKISSFPISKENDDVKSKKKKK